MKKNISINISGIIFHIDEDGYEKLKAYLDSINRYFSTFDDSHEIIADIESRIAEIFLSKLKDGKQVIALEDVDGLMATMGSIKDFQAAEEQGDYKASEEKKKKEAKEEQQEDDYDPSYYSTSTKLYRDEKRKLLAGVLAGIANYFNIDPLWIRLLYILFFFGVSFLPAIGGVLLVLYIVLWIILPASYDLKEDRKTKKMYRDPDNKVIAGVCSGVAAYFGIDITIVRLLFFVGILAGGSGLILYIILWVILPEARTITDRMEMQGQPVTLSNIEHNIKKSLNVKEGEENVFIKILLFPFRLIADLIEFLSKALGPFTNFLLEALRIVIGIILILIGFVAIAALIITFGVALGIFNAGDIANIHGVPLDVLSNDINVFAAIAVFFAVLIPMLALALLGFVVLLKKKVINERVGWAMLGLWLVSLAISSVYIGRISREFSIRATEKAEIPLIDNAGLFLFKMEDVGDNDGQDFYFNIKQSKNNQFYIELKKEAYGKNRETALTNANAIDYQVAQVDSTITFDSYFTFKDDALFRVQRMVLTMYMPEGRQFRFDPSMRELIGSYLNRNGYSIYDFGMNTWYYENGDLQCLDCNEFDEDDEDREEIEAYEYYWGDADKKEFQFDNFDRVQINQNIKAEIRQSDNYQVFASGKDKDLENLVIRQKGEEIQIYYSEGELFDWTNSDRKVQVYIEMPILTKLKIDDSGDATVSNFDGVINLVLEEAATADINVETEVLYINASGASRINLSGSTDVLEIKCSGASTVDGKNFVSNDAFVKTNGASNVKVFAEDVLEIDAGGASMVTYRGDAKVDIERSRSSTVEKD